MGPKMSNTHDGDEKIPTPSTLGRIRVKGTTSHILWYSDWLHNTFFTRNSIFVANHNTTSVRSIIICSLSDYRYGIKSQS